LTLRFEGLTSVRRIGDNLIFGPFSRLRFDWIAYGNNAERGSKEYTDGEVWMFAPGGRVAQSPLIARPLGRD
jgi:hypothetical protein